MQDSPLAKERNAASVTSQFLLSFQCAEATGTRAAPTVWRGGKRGEGFPWPTYPKQWSRLRWEGRGGGWGHLTPEQLLIATAQWMQEHPASAASQSCCFQFLQLSPLPHCWSAGCSKGFIYYKTITSDKSLSSKLSYTLPGSTHRAVLPQHCTASCS